MYSAENLEHYETALAETLDNTVYRAEIIGLVQADAEELRLAANTVSIIFLDNELAHELSKYSEFLFEMVRKYATLGDT